MTQVAWQINMILINILSKIDITLKRARVVTEVCEYSCQSFGHRQLDCVYVVLMECP